MPNYDVIFSNVSFVTSSGRTQKNTDARSYKQRSHLSGVTHVLGAIEANGGIRSISHFSELKVKFRSRSGKKIKFYIYKSG